MARKARSLHALAGMAVAASLLAMAPSPEQASAPDTALDGHALFTTYCVRCHGEDGGKRRWGAKDLRASHMAPELMRKQVREGKGIMPAFARKLTPEEIEAVTRYARTLRKEHP